jgi:hypothetical protein
VNPTQALVIGVPQYVKNQWMVNGDKTIDGVIDDFSFNLVHAVAELLNQLLGQSAKVQIP